MISILRTLWLVFCMLFNRESRSSIRKRKRISRRVTAAESFSHETLTGKNAALPATCAPWCVLWIALHSKRQRMAMVGAIPNSSGSTSHVASSAAIAKKRARLMRSN